jgi:hypothetical protein
MPELLKAVAGTTPVRFGILRISASDGRLSGKLLVVNNSDIAGAQLADGSAHGYPAARRLLAVAEGNYAFLDVGLKRPATFESELCLSINRTISSWPNLPEHASELFDEKSLLDKIFGSNAQSGSVLPAVDMSPLAGTVNRGAGFGWTTNMPLGTRNAAPPAATNAGTTAVASRPAAPAPQAVGSPAQPFAAAEADMGLKSVWSFMQPLFDTGPLKSFPLEDTSSKRGSLNNLRRQQFDSEEASRPWYTQLFREAFLSRQALISLGLGVVVFSLILVTSFSNSSGKQNNSLKHNNSLTIQKGVTPATHL